MRIALAALFVLGCGPSAPVGDAADAGDGLGTEDPGGGGGGVGACQELRSAGSLAGPRPDLMLVVERSESMAEPIEGAEDRMSALAASVTEVVVAHHAFVNLGLMLFPANDGCSAGTVTTHIEDESWQQISGALWNATPGGGSPAHTTLRMALLYFNAIEPNPDGRYVLLATDGAPSCRTIFEPDDPSVDETLDAIEALRDAGISTFVVGLGDADRTTLDQLAAAGGTGAAFRAGSTAELNQALGTLTQSLSSPSCDVPLSRVPDSVERMEVFLDDVLVAAEDWRYDPATNSVELLGGACDELQSGAVSSVRVFLGCDGPQVD